MTYLVGTAGTGILGVLLLPLYAFFVKTSDFGTFDYIQTLGALASAVIFVAGWESIIRFAMARHVEWELPEVTRATITIGLVGSVAAIAAAACVSLLRPDRAGVAFAAAAVAVLTGYLYIWQFTARATGQPRLFVLSGLLNALVNILGIVVLVVVLRLGLIGLLLSYPLGMASAIIFLERRLRLLRRSAWSWPSQAVVKDVIWFATPMMLDFLAAFLILAFGRILITSTLGATANGQFAFALKISTAVGTIASVLTMAALEETVLRAHTEGVSEYLSKLVTGAWLLLMSGSVIVVLAARLAYAFLGNTGYADSFPLVPMLTLASAFGATGSIIGNSFQVGKKTSFIFYTTVVSTVLVIVGSLSLIHVVGPTGVALSMMVGNGVCLLLRRILAQRIIRIREDRIIFVPILLFAAAWVTTVLPLPVTFVIGLGATFSAVGCYFAYRAVRHLRHIEPVIPSAG